MPGTYESGSENSQSALSVFALLDVASPQVTSDELERQFVASLGLLMADDVTLSHVEIFEAAHIGSRGGPSEHRPAHEPVDEFRVCLVPYLAGKGPRVFDDRGQATRLELVSVTPAGGGIIELIYHPIR